MGEAFTRALRKLSFTVTKDYSGSDTRQVPASGVTIAVYKQGATVSGAQTVTDTTQDVTITCFDAGRLSADVPDTVQRATDVIAGNATPTCTVDSVDITSSPQYSDVVLDSASDGAMAFNADERMVVIDNQPVLYDEGSGISILAALTTDATGYAECYVRERFVDVKMSGGGITTKMLYNEMSGETHHGMRLNVLDFDSPQAAVDACPQGGTVFWPAGQYEIDNPLVLTRSIHMTGEGASSGTTIRGLNNTQHLISCTTDGIRRVIIEGFKISGATTTTAQNGINVVIAGSRPDEFRFENLFIEKCGNHGIYLESVNYPYISNVRCEGNYGDGIYINSAAWVTALHCFMNGNKYHGVHARNCLGFWWNGIGIQDNQPSGGAGVTEAQMFIDSCQMVLIEGSDFENSHTAVNNTALVIQDSDAVTVQNNLFFNSTVGSTIGIYLHADNSGVFIGPNVFKSVATGIIYGSVAQVTTITRDALIAPQFWDTVTTEMTLPPVADRDNQNITIIGCGTVGTEGLMLPTWATGNEPTPDANNEGAIAYDLTTTTVKFSDGAAGTWTAI